MRRTDFEMAEREEMLDLLATAEHGYMGILTPDASTELVEVGKV